MKTAAFILTVTLIWAPLTAQVMQAAAPETVFQSLTEQEGASMTLELDLSSFVAQKRSKNYFPAVLKTNDGTSYNVDIRARGRFRRMNADIPPFKIRFRKGDLHAQGLDSLNEIKVVLPMETGAKGNELLVKEYLAYQMFERITGAGIRARLVTLTLCNTNDGKSKPQTALALFIEDEEEAAARLGGALVEQYGITTEQLEPYQAAKVALFQYMIGNTDWDFEMQRNIRFVQLPDSGKILALPYDFDFSGLVNAPYASPDSKTGLRDVRDRLLMAGTLPADALHAARQMLLDKKAEFLEICRTGFLSKNTVSQIVRYLDTFFNRLEDAEDMPTVMRM